MIAGLALTNKKKTEKDKIKASHLQAAKWNSNKSSHNYVDIVAEVRKLKSQ